MKSTTPQQHDKSLDLNGNQLPAPIRILRATAYGTIGLFIVLMTFIGADTTLGTMQTTFSACGAFIAFLSMRLTQWRKSLSPTNRLALFLFLGSMTGTVIGTVLFGGWSLSDSIFAGLGSGSVLGLTNSLGGIALRASIQSFSKYTS